MVVPCRNPRKPADSRAEWRGFSAWVLQNFHAGGRGFRAGGREFSVQAGADLPCGFGLKMAETRRRTSCTTTGWRIEKHVARIIRTSMLWVIFVLHLQNPLIVPHGIRWLSVRNPLSVRTESADCTRGHTRTAARLYADYSRGRLQKKLRFPCHVPYSAICAFSWYITWKSLKMPLNTHARTHYWWLKDKKNCTLQARDRCIKIHTCACWIENIWDGKMYMPDIVEAHCYVVTTGE